MEKGDDEMQNGDRENALRAHDELNDQLQGFNRAAIETANIAVRSLLLINGGASVALLAFVGAVESGNSAINSDVLVEPIWRFAVGVGLAVLTAIFAYLVNYLDAVITGAKLRIWEHPYIEETSLSKKLNIFRNVLFCAALLAAACSAILYFLGVWSITAAILNMGI